MSKHQAIKAIRTEVSRLNQEIDLKIIRGLSYSKEARRHKLLMSQLYRLSRERVVRFPFIFGRVFFKMF
jgi:hypothetical protein